MSPESSEEQRETGTSNKHISDIIGNWGPYQRRIFLIATIIYIANPIQNLSLVLYTPQLDFWCTDPLVERNNLTKNVCTVEGEECRSFAYDLKNYSRTLTSDLDLVCGKSIYISMGQSFHQVGYAISGVAFGFISDNWGRLFSLKIAMTIEIIAGFIQALTTSSTLWLINRIFIGASVYGRFLNFYVIIMEWVGPKSRAPAVILNEMGYAIGYLALPVIGYFFNYRIIHTGLSLAQIVALVVVFHFIPDSPRWQLTHNETEKARRQLIKALEMKKVSFDEERVNGRIIQMHRQLKAQMEREKTDKVASVFDVMRSPKMLKTSLILLYLWFTAAFNYYGAVFNLGSLGGNIFLNMLIFAVSQTLSNLFCHFSATKFGRQKLLVGYFLVEGASFFTIVAFSGSDSFLAYRMAAAFVVVFTANASFNIVYLYTGETYPTIMRQSTLGTFSIFSRVGSATSPFIKELISASHLSVGMSIFGGLAAGASLASLFLKETSGKEIPETVGQAIANQEEDENKNLKDCNLG